MGCVSSKHFKEEIQRDIHLLANADYANHIVSLTSSTYGALQLDKDHLPQMAPELLEQRKSVSRLDPEIINTWELMQDLEELPISIPSKKSPKPKSFLRGLADLDPKTPLKFLNSPKKFKKSGGKENKGQINRWDNSPRRVLKASNNLDNSRKNSPSLTTPLKCDVDLGVICSRRRSLGPLFDPQLVESLEKELVQQKEGQHMTKKTASTRKSQEELESLLQAFDEKCPPGGEKSVVIYTTTLRGIRKTFEDCNAARRIIESHGVEMIERDVSMDSGYKEELRGLMGTKQVKVPVVFVKGRVIGGGEEIVRLEEEGKLGILFEGIGKAKAGGCRGCDGVRFMMCVVCNGSCKVLDEEGNKKCGECNENGLIHCPLCSC